MCFTLLFTGLWDYSSRVGDGVKRRRNAGMTRQVALPKTCEEIQGGFFQHLDPPLNQDFHKVVTPLHIGLPRFPLLKNKLYCRGQLISHYLFLRTYIETCASACNLMAVEILEINQRNRRRHLLTLL